MEIIHIHLLSSFDSVFKVISNDAVLMSVSTKENLSEFLDLDIISPNTHFEISSYPIKSKDKNFSYSAKFRCENNNLISETEYVKVFKMPENHFLIKFLPFSIKKQEIYADKLEINDSEIKMLSFLNDMSGRAKVEVLKVEDTKIRKSKEYFVYVNGEDKSEIPSDLISLAFFEAYIANDFITCFTYLSEDFSSKLNKDSLKEFLGEVDSCYSINYYPTPAVVLLNDKNCAIFSSNIRNNKITDIYELNN